MNSDDELSSVDRQAWSVDLYALERYRHQHAPLGHFLKAIVTNDLMGATHFADTIRRPMLANYASYVFNQLPAMAVGSPEAYDRWLLVGSVERATTLGDRNGE